MTFPPTEHARFRDLSKVSARNSSTASQYIDDVRAKILVTETTDD